MMTIPANATVIASHVRSGTGSCRRKRPASAARSGETLISTLVLATVVRVSEPMKKKNVPARNAPAITPGQPTRGHCARHRAAVDDEQHAANEERHEQRTPEHDLPRVGDRQLAHQESRPTTSRSRRRS